MIGTLSAAFLGVVGKGIRLTEDVTVQGVAPVAGVSESFYVSGSAGQTTFSDGVVSGSADFSLAICSAVDIPSGYSVSAGGIGFADVTFTANDTGAKPDMAFTGGDGTVYVSQQGVDAVAGVYEVHTITPARTPTGGTAVIGGSSTAYDATPSVAGWSFNQALSAGVVTATADAYEDRSDTALAPDGIGLTG